MSASSTSSFLPRKRGRPPTTLSSSAHQYCELRMHHITHKQTSVVRIQFKCFCRHKAGLSYADCICDNVQGIRHQTRAFTPRISASQCNTKIGLIRRASIICARVLTWLLLELNASINDDDHAAAPSSFKARRVRVGLSRGRI